MFRPFFKVDIKICEVFIVNGTNYCFLLRFAMGPVIDIVLYSTLDSFLTLIINSVLTLSKKKPIMGKELIFVCSLLVTSLILNL